jgi:hypothetical protein
LTFNENGNKTPPFTADLTFGQNEAVTQGHLHGHVIRADGFYPLKLDKSDAPVVVFLFGTVQLAASRAKVEEPLVMSPAPATVLPSATSVALLPRSLSNRDTYRIGVGLDIISVVKKLANR